MWLILLGLILIGAAIYYSWQNKREQGEVSPTVPTTPMTAYVLYGFGVALCGAAVYLFFNVANQSGYYAFAFFVTSIGCLIAGVNAFKKGYDAHQKHASNMEALARAKIAHAEHERQQIAVENARREAIEQADLNAKKRSLEMRRLDTDHRLADDEEETRQMQLQTAQRELKLRGNLMETGEQNGLDLQGIVDVNKHKYKKKIDLQSRWEETEQDLIAADFADSRQQRQIIAEQRAEHEKLVRERSKIEKKEKDQYVKEKLLARYDKDIANLEAEIDAREARLVLPEVGKENRRLT